MILHKQFVLDLAGDLNQVSNCCRRFAIRESFKSLWAVEEDSARWAASTSNFLCEGAEQASTNTHLEGYAQNEFSMEVLELFAQMQQEGF